MYDTGLYNISHCILISAIVFIEKNRPGHHLETTTSSFVNHNFDNFRENHKKRSKNYSLKLGYGVDSDVHYGMLRSSEEF